MDICLLYYYYLFITFSLTLISIYSIPALVTRAPGHKGIYALGHLLSLESVHRINYFLNVAFHHSSPVLYIKMYYIEAFSCQSEMSSMLF